MLKLRPLIVVTGSLHAKGGTTYERRDVTSDQGDRDAVEVKQRREVTKDRRKADVIVTAYARKLVKLRLLYTPFGHLLLPTELPALRTLLYDATKAVAEFNRNATQKPVCRLFNEYVWEPLGGNRKAALEGWFARELQEGDEEVVRVLPEVQDGGTGAVVVEPAVAAE